MNWIEILGQELLFDASGIQPIERLLYIGTRRKANSHNSANPAIQSCCAIRQVIATMQTLGRPYEICDGSKISILKFANVLFIRNISGSTMCIKTFVS